MRFFLLAKCLLFAWLALHPGQPSTPHTQDGTIVQQPSDTGV